MNPQKVKGKRCVIQVGFVEHLHSKPFSYNSNVHSSGFSGVGGTQKLQAHVERTRVEKNQRNSSKDTKS